MKSRHTLRIGCAVVLVDMLGVGILIPVIPLLFTDPSYPYHFPISLQTGYLLLGGLTALYPFAMFLAMPILGQLSDTFGRRPILALSLFGTGISYALFAVGIMTRNIPLLFAARALDGLTGGNVAVVQAAVADTSTEEERVRDFGLISAANGIGFILGPVIGAVLSDPSIVSWFGAPTPFWFAAGLAGINMLAVLFFFPETLKTRIKKRIIPWQAFANIREAATGAERRPLYITAFLYQSGFAFIVTFFGVFLVSRFGFGQRDIGLIFAFVGLLLALTQLMITRPLSRRLEPATVIPLALAAMSASLVWIYFVESTLVLYMAVLPTAIAAGLIVANLTGLISTTAGAKQHGSVLGINASVQSLAQAIPPVFAGVIAALFAPTTPVLFAAFSIAAALVFYLRFARPHLTQ
jgi:MFS transporter, DHA1 family, tetracycline resistance protein